MGLNKFPTNVNYYQMILLVNGGHVSPDWLKLRVLQLHLHANLIKKWLRWMDKAENGESDNWDVDYHMSHNVIPSCLFLLSQVIEPEKYHQHFDDFYKWKVFIVIHFSPNKNENYFSSDQSLVKLAKTTREGVIFCFCSFRLRDGGKQGAHDIAELWHHTNWHLLKESQWIFDHSIIGLIFNNYYSTSAHCIWDDR